MPTIFHRPLPALWLALLALGSPALAQEVLVVTDGHHPVRSVPGARVILLDAPEHIEDRLSAGLPVDAGMAEVFARRRLQAAGNDVRTLAMAYQDVAQAWGLGIVSIPAVVVERRYVVYGEPDVARAVERIAAFRRARP